MRQLGWLQQSAEAEMQAWIAEAAERDRLKRNVIEPVAAAKQVFAVLDA